MVRMHKWMPGECRQHLGKRGYFVVSVDGDLIPVHRMVAKTFIPNPDGKPQVAHGDGVRTHNNVENLRWATNAENSADMEVHGTRLRGDDHPTRKLSEAEVTEIRAALEKKLPRHPPLHKDLAERYGVTRECITGISNKRRWSHAAAPHEATRDLARVRNGG